MNPSSPLSRRTSRESSERSKKPEKAKKKDLDTYPLKKGQSGLGQSLRDTECVDQEKRRPGRCIYILSGLLEQFGSVDPVGGSVSPGRTDRSRVHYNYNYNHRTPWCEPHRDEISRYVTTFVSQRLTGGRPVKVGILDKERNIIKFPFNGCF